MLGPVNISGGQSWDVPLGDVLAAWRDARERFIRVVEGLSDQGLNDLSRFPGMSAERPPWLAIATRSSPHDEEHIEVIRATFSPG